MPAPLRLTPALLPWTTCFGALFADYAGPAAAKGLDLRMVPSCGTLWTDDILLERILRNLVENALRYTPRGRVIVGGRRRGAALRIDVLDTGPAFPGNKSVLSSTSFVSWKTPSGPGRAAMAWAWRSSGAPPNCSTTRWRSGPFLAADHASRSLCRWSPRRDKPASRMKWFLLFNAPVQHGLRRAPVSRTTALVAEAMQWALEDAGLHRAPCSFRWPRPRACSTLLCRI